MGYYGGYKPYESVADKKLKAAKKLEKLKKKNKNLLPVVVEGTAISKKWWGKAWLKHLESYADYANRLPRGKSYVKQGAIFDLQVTEGKIEAMVNGSGSKVYDVEVKVKTLSKDQWQRLVDLGQNNIESLGALCEGQFSKDMQALLKNPSHGLFPKASEISFTCSCPDWAVMCKHVAAVLYGFATRLDDDPLLFFKLRDTDMKDLLQKSVDEKVGAMLKNAGVKTSRTLSDDQVHDLFGIEMD